MFTKIDTKSRIVALGKCWDQEETTNSRGQAVVCECCHQGAPSYDAVRCKCSVMHSNSEYDIIRAELRAE